MQDWNECCFCIIFIIQFVQAFPYSDKACYALFLKLHVLNKQFNKTVKVFIRKVFYVKKELFFEF